eukprot:COSAG06_NODE_5350_length_3532_cov_40.227789_2_plen_31_part_00
MTEIVVTTKIKIDYTRTRSTHAQSIVESDK